MFKNINSLSINIKGCDRFKGSPKKLGTIEILPKCVDRANLLVIFPLMTPLLNKISDLQYLGAKNNDKIRGRDSLEVNWG